MTCRYIAVRDRYIAVQLFYYIQYLCNNNMTLSLTISEWYSTHVFQLQINTLYIVSLKVLPISNTPIMESRRFVFHSSFIRCLER